MVLYTIIEPELIGFLPEFAKAQSDKGYGATQIIDYEGVKLEVMPATDNTFIVNRIISTDPADYIRPRLQPGCRIHLTFTAADHCL
ncbi:MAG TPA: YlzJ-like family protein [Candidatus Atribacteria bacterium]|nr:YlzJ-like family protein [Candidatus Atribacteria bacterium]